MTLNRRSFFWWINGALPGIAIFAKNAEGGSHRVPKPSALPTVPSVLELRNLAPASAAVYCLCYAEPGDGGGGIFFWNAGAVTVDDGGIVIAPAVPTLQGRWVRQTTIGDIDVRWFGAKGDGISDDTAAFRRARDYARGLVRREPAVADDPLGSVVIRVSAGTFVITEAEAMLDRHWPSSAIGLKYEGLGVGISTIRYTPRKSGPLVYNNNALLFLRFSGLLFVCDDPDSTFYEAVSLGQAQDVSCEDVGWWGKWRFGFSLSGSNTNSEYKWDKCAIGGRWEYFLNVSGSDQLLNYWFARSKFWVTDGGGWVRMSHGGHLKITQCDVSGWKPFGDRPLFALLGSVHARGVCHFLCSGSRFEIHSEDAPILHSQWPHGVISFLNCDFGSQAPWRSPSYIIALIEIGSDGHAILSWQDCTLIGRHVFRQTTADLSTSRALQNNTPILVNFTGCTHLTAEFAHDILELDSSLVTTGNVPQVEFHNCRSEMAADPERAPARWDGASFWYTGAAATVQRRVATLGVPPTSLFVATLADLPRGALITQIQVCLARQPPPEIESAKLTIKVPGKELLSLSHPASHEPSLLVAWTAPAAGDYVVFIRSTGSYHGAIAFEAEGGQWLGPEMSRQQQINGRVRLIEGGQLKIFARDGYSGSLIEGSIRKVGEEVIFLADWEEVVSHKTLKSSISFLVENKNDGLLTVEWRGSLADDLADSGPILYLLVDYVG